MTPFDINPDNDAGHAIDQDDLIAFHLHDLPSPQERAVRRILNTRPDLQAESIAIASTLRAFPKQEPGLPLDTAALDRNWLALRDSLPVLVPSSAPLSLFTRWAVPTFAVAALAVTAVILTLHHKPHATSSTIATNGSPSSAITTSPASTTAQHFPIFADPFPPFSAPHRSSIRNTSRTNAAPQQRLDSAAASSKELPPTNGQPSQSTISSPFATSPSYAITATTQQSQSSSTSTPLKPTSTPIIPTRSHHDHTTDITLAALGNLTPDRSFTSADGTVSARYTQETTPSVGALASFHQQLRPWLGYRITGSYSEPTFQYVYQAGAEGSEGNIVRQHAYEFSGTYVVQGPHRRRISTAAEAGAGLLALLPADNANLAAIPVSNSFRPEGVFGVSAELALSRHLAIHAGYRALLYKAPTAYPTYGTAVPPIPSNLTLSNQPVLGLTYRFRPANE